MDQVVGNSERATMYNRNRVKLGLFDANCSSDRVSGLTRRKLICGSLAFAGTSSLLRLPATAASMLPLTPRQTPGPFYPQSFPQDADNDLVHVAGHQGAAQGSVTRITGRILEPNGRPVPGARIEIWQCDSNGRYHYVRNDRTDQPRDE